MRVSKDPADKAYDPDSRIVRCNDIEVANWITADDFRRIVIAEDKTYHGNVYIEPLEKDRPPQVVEVPIPLDIGFAGGMFVNEPEPKKIEAVTVVEEPIILIEEPIILNEEPAILIEEPAIVIEEPSLIEPQIIEPDLFAETNDDEPSTD